MPERMSRKKSAAEIVPSQNEYDHAIAALLTLAGNQCSAKLETTASPASRSDRGR